MFPPHDPETELRDHLPVAEWREAVRAICARHGVPDVELEPFASGSDVVWAAGDRVVKLTAPMWAPEIEAEVRCLELVAGRLSVRTPEVLASGELDGWPYVVATRVPGVALRAVWPELDRAERLWLAAQLGRLTRELHAIERPAGPDGWEAFWAACRANVAQRHAEPEVPAGLAAEIDAFLSDVGDLDGGPHVLLHTELMDEHVLVRERGGRFELCALLDFADGRVGPCEYDFPAPVEFVFRGEPGLLRAYLEAYGRAPGELDAAYSERLLAWGLSHRFGRLRRMLEVVSPARPATLRELAQSLYGLSG